MDLRGHGLSSELVGLSAKIMADDVQAVMDHCGGDRFTLVGFGMGGYAALAWRILCQQHLVSRVEGIVLVSSYSRLPNNWTCVLFHAMSSSGLIHLFWQSKRIARFMSRPLFGKVATPVSVSTPRGLGVTF